MEAGCPGRQAGSLAEIRIRLILYAKNCLGKRARMACDSEGILEGIPLLSHTGIASDPRMSSPLTGLFWFDDIIRIIVTRLVS